MVRVLRPIPVDKLKLLVFDLDGTLIDSAQDLCNSVNATLEHVGLPRLPEPTIASFVGNGVSVLVLKSLAAASGKAPGAIEQQMLEHALEYFLGYYREHKLDFTYAYEGVLEALTALSQLHDTPSTGRRTMAVLTNKPSRPARGICEGLGMGDYFLRIYGGDSFAAKKPDPMGMRALMEEVGATPEETVMIGDSQVDVLTARNAGTWCIGCDFGFGERTVMNTPPDILVDTAADWTEALSPAKIDLTEKAETR